MQDVIKIGFFSVSAGWKNNKAILILKYRGPYSEPIKLLYQEPNDSEELWEDFQLSSNEEKIALLPQEYKNWEVLHIQINGPRKTVSVKRLEELLDNAKRQSETEKLTSGPEPHSNSLESLEKSSNSPGQNLQFASPSPPQEVSIPKPSKSEQSLLVKSTYQKSNKQQIAKLQAQILKLEQAVTESQKQIDSFREQIAELLQENSELKRQCDTQTNAMLRDPEHVFREAVHRVLLTLFGQQENGVGEIFQDPRQICKGIETEIRRFEAQFDGEMIYTLSVVKEHLTRVRGLIHFELSELPSQEKSGENQSEQLAKLVLTDKPPDEVQFPYLGELGKAYWDDLKTFTTKMPQIIVEIQALLHRIVIQLLDGFSPYRAKTAKEKQMSRCFYEDYLPNILRMMSLELVPIEIGQTEADSRIHDIQGSQRGTYQRGVVADIIQHGVRRISDKQIVRKPVVMRGEPE